MHLLDHALLTKEIDHFLFDPLIAKSWPKRSVNSNSVPKMMNGLVVHNILHNIPQGKLCNTSSNKKSSMKLNISWSHLPEEFDSQCDQNSGWNSSLNSGYISIVPLSRDKKIFLSRCPFVPGQGQEQMSRDKTLCPGTSRGTKWPKNGQKMAKKWPKLAKKKFFF